MRWGAGWFGQSARSRAPHGGEPVPVLDSAWTVGWPRGGVRAVGDGQAELAVIGECGADNDQLWRALATVRSRDWRTLTTWPGSYLVVARCGETLAVIGDLSEQHPVYWRPERSGVWWSTSATALAALDGAPVDTVSLASRVAFGQPDVLGTRSLFRTVNRVPTGHLLLVTPEWTSAVRYEPAEAEPVDLRHAAPTVRAALTAAVTTRLGDLPVSGDLAGLDSTTLVCLAAQRTPVTAMTFADERLRDDDVAYATRTSATVPGVSHRTVPGSPDTVYYNGLDDLGSLPVTDAPNAYVVTASIKRAVLDAAIGRRRAGVHFTGAGGDAVLSAPSSYLSDLLRSGQRLRAWQHAQAHARLRHTTALTVLRRARPASRSTLTEAWAQLAAELRCPPSLWAPQAQQPVAWTPLLATAAWMAPDMRHQLAAALDTAAANHLDAPSSLAAWSDRQDLARVGANTAGWREIARASHGVELAAPFLDNEVIRACLAVPAQQRAAPGRYKPLLAEAFARSEVIPDFVMKRITKGGFNALSYAGLRENAAILRDLIGPTSRLAAAGLITDAPVADMLARAATGQPTAQGALHLAVSAEVWLRQVDTAKASWWEVNSRATTA
ncbi:albusnodin/ikarugamycin family macrolactam cyclase [Streptomyces sp. CFMR 7]|uniref:albusnodin/ikarugamycin family macrolactam cyclase n=1 Tax=Streptomyces sp. CFMR 7 TaxID=1649184 RepID=UPI0011A0C223|nr:albusnodin/ikarugamycin family macrolactam cyclase [Streptomyces sp. CFMR 7]